MLRGGVFAASRRMATREPHAFSRRCEASSGDGANAPPHHEEHPAIPKWLEAMREGIASQLALGTMTRLTSPTNHFRDPIYDPHRRWRLSARDQYLRADQGDL